MKYCKITFQQLLDSGFETLIEDHYLELSDQAFTLDPDYEQYLLLDKAGMLVVIGAYDNCTLVGYAVHIVIKHLHYRNSLHSMEDLYYLKPQYRKGMEGIKFLKVQEQYLIESGVDKIIFGTKCRKNVGVLFKRLGYTHFEELYSKVIN